MNTIIQVYYRELYGTKYYYPENTVGKLILKLTGMKTLREKDIHVLQELGFEIELISVNPFKKESEK